MKKNGGLTAFIFLIVCLHLWASYVYFKNYLEMNTLSPPEIIRLFLESSQRVPPDELAKVMEPLGEVRLKVQQFELSFSISSSPQWPIRIKMAETEAFLKKWDEKSPPLHFSYQLATGYWLNFNQRTVSPFTELVGPLVLSEVLIAGMIIFYLWSTSRFTVPLRNFKKLADNLGKDVTSQPFPTPYDGPDTVREAVEAMNIMQKRIQDLIENRTKMLASISHDLRTPITRLKLRTQFLQNPEQAKKIERDLKEMESLIDTLLNYLKENKTLEKKVKLDIPSLLDTLCDEFIEQGYSIFYSLPEEKLPPFYGSPLALKRAFSNVITNGVKYGTQVWITVAREAQHIVISIQDDGPGIPEDELKKVFEAFYRSDSTKTSTGTGLGLTIVSSIIQEHQGTILLENPPSGGLKVIIHLPLSQA